MLKVSRNPDPKKYDEVTEAVKQNNGYCPCLIARNEDTKCMCKEFRDAVSEGKVGPCRCGRFVASEE